MSETPLTKGDLMAQLDGLGELINERMAELRAAKIEALAWQAVARNCAQSLALAAVTVEQTDPDLAAAMTRTFRDQCAAHGLTDPIPAGD